MIIAFDAGWAYLVVLNKEIRLPEKFSYIGIFLGPSVLVPSGLISVKQIIVPQSRVQQKDVLFVMLNLLISEYLCHQ